MAKKEVAVIEEKPVVLFSDKMSGFLHMDAGAGGEDVGQDDLVIPFVRICQALSKARQKSHENYIPGIDEGMIYHTGTKQLWDGENGVSVVPITFARRYTEWWPLDSKQGQGLVRDWGQDDSGLQECSQDDESGSFMTPRGTEIVTSRDFFCYAVDVEAGTWDPIVLSMTGSQSKKARQWLSRLTTMKQRVGEKIITPPFFFGLWQLCTKEESNKQGSWHGWDIKYTGPVFTLPFGEDLYLSARQMKQDIASGKVKSAVDDAEPASGTASGGAASGGVVSDDIPF
jgi:hypothetical protein